MKKEDRVNKNSYKGRDKLWKKYSCMPIAMITGANLVLNPHCEYSRKRFIYQKSEVPEIIFMNKTVKPGDWVMDIGANIGYWTTAFSFQVGKTGKVIAFEPNPNTVRYLKKNIRLNYCRNVRIFPVGISDCNKKGNLYIADNHSGDDRIYLTKKSSRREINIDIKTLDSFEGEIQPNRLSFIKIDVQGSEFFVLKGAQRILMKNNPIILIEFDQEQYEDAGISVEDFYRLCRDLSFCIYKLPVIESVNQESITFEEIDLLNKNHKCKGNIILKRKG